MSSVTDVIFQSPLPHIVDVLSTCSRWMAYAVLTPIAVLALVDVVGWSMHKALLRPLGYARTVRFKDPDPPSMLIAVKAPSSSSSIEPGKERSQIISETLDSSSASSTSSSPIISYSHLSPSDSPPRYRSSSHSPPREPPAALQGGYPVLRRSSSTGSNVSDSETFYKRHRAASIGVEGPLFPAGELQSPGRSDDELELHSSEAESDSPKSAGSLRRRRTKRAGMPRGGPAFGFTHMGDRSG